MANENSNIRRMDDPELVKRLQEPASCRAAMNEVIRLYSEPLYWQIRRLVQRHEDADDILQNTFIKAWMSIENFRGDAKLGTWLYKIALNESLTFLSKEQKRAEISLDNTESSIAEKIETDEWIDGDETSVLLRKAIATLPEKQRVVFNMRYFDEMKYEEISKILGTTVGALKASYHLATKKIEQFLNDHSV